uniref:Kelch repeat-containing protein n=1 Tax=Tetraselmis sp. GSL018 TaxID=582737 RepID=A0A061RNI8_9CHLO
MIYSAVKPNTLTDVRDGRCPAIDKADREDLVAYYRFNEGAVRDEHNRLVPQINAWATKDSSGKGNDGFVGLFSDETAQNREMHIRCPAGYVISEILFANYGSSKGGYGTYEFDECGAANSMSYVEERCLNRRSCKVLAAYSIFGNPCRRSSKTLAVNAICALPAPDHTRAPWAIGDPAPHWVGSTGAPDVVCPFDVFRELPESFRAALPPGMSCDEWDLGNATAGETEYFMLRLRDQCGYRNRFPQKRGGFITIVNTTILVLDEGDEHEPVMETGVSGQLLYPPDYRVPRHVPHDDDTCVIGGGATPETTVCGMVLEPPSDPVPVEYLWAGSNGGFFMYCSRYRDVYLGMYNATYSHERATLSLNLDKVGGRAFRNMHVDVAPAELSVAASTTCTADETAPDCSPHVCRDIIAEAGVEAMLEFIAKDRFGNRLRHWDDLPALSLKIEGGQSAAYNVTRGAIRGVFEFFIIFPHEGSFSVTIEAGGEPGCQFTATVSTQLPREAIVYGTAPEARFQHSMVEHNDDLYMFGGSRRDKTYLAETWVLSTGYRRFAHRFHYRRSVRVRSGRSMGSGPHVLEVDIPSREWMRQGKLQADCADILFLDSSGRRMDYWIEPRGAPSGCGSPTAKLWVEVHGTSEFHLYYGNRGFESYSDPAVFSKGGLGMFEDFEYEDSPLDHGWDLSAAHHDSCSPLEPGKTGDPRSFSTTTQVSLSGNRSMMVDAYSRIGGSVKKTAGAAAIGSNFVLKGFFFDTYCHGFHYLSPDFDVCRPVMNTKALLPDTRNAAGVYTDSKQDRYCFTYPWIASGVDRTIAWHSFAFVGSDTELKMYVDEVEVATTEPTNFSSVFVAGGNFVDDDHAGARGYWDAVLALQKWSDVSAAVGDEQPVFFSEAHRWRNLSSLELSPPARQAHSAVVYDGGMYIFGGERSYHAYSDVWRYDFTGSAWSFIPSTELVGTLSRYDHSAVVYNDTMFVYGGRSPEARGNLLMYDFSRRSWHNVATESMDTMRARFGHGAVVIDDFMYVYGGYIYDVGATNEVWSYDFQSKFWTKIGPRKENTVVDAYYAMIFPQMLPHARFSTAIVGRKTTNTFYIIGGEGGEHDYNVLMDVAGFPTDSELKQWFLVHRATSASSIVARHDSSAALIDDMWACAFGGVGESKFLNDTVCIFVGDMGLSMPHRDS